MDSFWGVLAVVLGGAVLVFGAIMFGGRTITRHYDSIECRSFGQQSGREVKFVDYNYWSWGCLTPTTDGKWIDVDNLREFGDQN